MSRAISTRRLVRENSRFYKVTFQTKKESIEYARSDQIAQQTKNRFAKRNQHCDVAKKKTATVKII